MSVDAQSVTQQCKCRPRRLEWQEGPMGAWEAFTAIGVYRCLPIKVVDAELEGSRLQVAAIGVIDKYKVELSIDDRLDFVYLIGGWSDLENAKKTAQAHFDGLWRDMTDASYYIELRKAEAKARSVETQKMMRRLRRLANEYGYDAMLMRGRDRKTFYVTFLPLDADSWQEIVMLAFSVGVEPLAYSLEKWKDEIELGVVKVREEYRAYLDNLRKAGKTLRDVLWDKPDYVDKYRDRLIRDMARKHKYRVERDGDCLVFSPRKKVDDKTIAEAMTFSYCGPMRDSPRFWRQYIEENAQKHKEAVRGVL